MTTLLKSFSIFLQTITALWLSGIFMTTSAVAAPKTLAANSPEVLAVKKAIRAVQPMMAPIRVDTYSQTIAQAAANYGIDPYILVAITDQESAFRENLPEGKMGEIGVNQIRKGWLKNQYFRAEFKRVNIKDLNNSAKSFFYAAWIIADLKKHDKPSTLPYWSRYNSPKFEHRQRYFQFVNRKLMKIRDIDPVYVASAE